MSIQCKNCDLYKKCVVEDNPVSGSGGSRKPKYMIVLDHSTKSDAKYGQTPSSDVALKLDYFLEKAGIHKSDVFVTSAIKCPIDKKAAGKVKKEHLDECAQYLLTEIDTYKPKVLIPAGKLAFQMLSGHKSVGEYVGHDYDFEFQVNEGSEEYPKIVDKKLKCFPSYSINTSLFMWKLDNRILRVLGKAKKFVEEGVVDKTPDPVVKVVLSLEDLAEFKKEMLSLKKSATDFETTGFVHNRDKIICSGYSVSPTKAWVVFHSTYKNKFTHKWLHHEKVLAAKINKFVNAHKAEIIQTLKEVHGSDIEWLLHNGKFDQKFAMFNGIPFKNFYWDTMVADSLIDENEGHSLNEVYVRNGINFGAYDTDLYPYVGKNDQKNYLFIPPQKIIKYLGYDVCGVHILEPKQKAHLEKIELLEHFLDRKMPTINEVLIPMEYVGVKYDKEMLIESSKNIQGRIDSTLIKLKTLTKDDAFNPNSGKQVSNYLIKKNFPFKKYDIRKTQDGYSTDKEAMAKYCQHEKFKVFGTLLGNFKKLVKIKGTYIDGKEGDGGMLQYIDEHGFLHANYNVQTAVTSRYSCKKPSLQVFPRPIEGIVNTRQFIMKSKPENIMFEADAKALEQYINAIVAKDEVLRAKILDGTDIHSFNATTLGKDLGWIADHITYEMFLENCGKGKKSKKEIDPKVYALFNDLRTKAKTVGFGLAYGKGAESYAKEFGISVVEAQEMIDSYFRLYKQTYEWRVRIMEQATTKGILKLHSGRRRRFTMAVNWINSPQGKKAWSSKTVRESIMRMAVNFPIQGNAHETFERGCLRLVRAFRKHGLTARIMLSIHDGIVGECLASEKDLVEKLIHESMPELFNEGTKYELGTAYDVGFYEDRWYGKEIA